MENNKILIGVKFTDRDRNGNLYHYDIELYVLRDITFDQLLFGIKFGLKKSAQMADKNQRIYNDCYRIFSSVVRNVKGESGHSYWPNLTFKSFNSTIAGRKVRYGEERTNFYFDPDIRFLPICELGFITSSQIIFDASGSAKTKGEADTRMIVDAFNPNASNRIIFPEYNISTRQLYRFDDTPVEIIAPSTPPRKPNTNLFFMLLPSILSVGILMVVRTVLMSSSQSSGMMMIALSGAMGLTAMITTTFTWSRQKSEYKKSLANWRIQYKNYINNSVLKEIISRQKTDTETLEELYPDVFTLTYKDERGIYTLNQNLYSRSVQDEDFLSIRMGKSDYVESMFPVKGTRKDEVFSEALFYLKEDKNNGSELEIYLRDEIPGRDLPKLKSLSDLPFFISEKYKYLKDAPLLYSLKNKRTLGIIDPDINQECSYAELFIKKMIFELCYYHSPENLQFVIFFRQKEEWKENPVKKWQDIEGLIEMYKFMPHFRGLFSDKAQFAFDSNSAGLILSNMLTIMSAREKNAAEGSQTHAMPHIVFIVYEDYGMKEHAFAEFLPSGQSAENGAGDNLGLTFIFPTMYKEYLPAYCDDIISFRWDGDRERMDITPHENSRARKEFTDLIPQGAVLAKMYQEYTKRFIKAFGFISSIYYAQIAQNGKVPSSVSVFNVFNIQTPPNTSSNYTGTYGNEARKPLGVEDQLMQMIRQNWGMYGNERTISVTESLRVPVGKTEIGTAYLDLHEKGDGPHMLVAGTTGSGKTETIITFLLGLCMQFRPDELNLLLVDMKGGGFTKRIGSLPHVVGTVTDVDGDENGTGSEYMLGRFLYAMKAEIKRRKLLTNKLGVDSVDAYIKACRDIDAHIARLDPKTLTESKVEEMVRTARENPLSHLILVVDEFTELKRFSNENSELDFMGEITTIARVGRSLGLHIILISQNIEGAITEDIRVNSRARLCLKVATRQASKEMIGTDLAASPYMPGNGRAYLLVGTGSKFEYFQSGYSGAGIVEEIPIEITLASKNGAYSTFYNSDKDNLNLIAKRKELKKNGGDKTQLSAITDAIQTVYQAEKQNISNIHMVFTPPLPSCISMNQKGEIVDQSGNRKDFGE